MAYTPFNGFTNILIHSHPDHLANSNAITLDATGEYIACIGRVFLASGPGTSKTISGTGGGKLFYRCQTLTLADAGTDISFGIQDVDNTTGLHDGTFDVEAVINTGNPITTTIGVPITMTTGTKTITHGDIIAIVLEMTTRGGADLMTIVGNTTASLAVASSLPYRVINTTGSAVKSGTGLCLFSIIFDDGTLGWIQRAEAFPNSNSSTNVTFNSSSGTNERGGYFSLPFNCKLEGVSFHMSTGGSNADFNINLYSTPTGTPSLMSSISCDANISVNGQANYTNWFSTPQTLTANTNYLISLEPTTTNSIILYYRSLVSSGNNVFRKMFNFDCVHYARAKSGNPAFSVVNDYDIFTISLHLNEISDGASTGGGEASHVF